MSLQVSGAAWEQGVRGKNISPVQCEEAEKLAGVRELGQGLDVPEKAELLGAQALEQLSRGTSSE